MIEVSDKVMAKIHKHAAQQAPQEACGVLMVYKGRHVYFPCRNLAQYDAADPTFIIHPEDWKTAEDMGEIVMVVHSHVFRPPQPTDADRVHCEKTQLPWLIVNHPLCTYVQFEPSGYEAPLYGRHYTHGVLDCYQFCRDYYKRTLSIELRNYEYPEFFWDKGLNLYRENFEKEGFVEIKGGPLKLHDALLMMCEADVESHAAVLIEDNVIGHHYRKRLSTTEVYGGYWRHVTTGVLRHKSLL
jgi:proteasome lid subunit RPN8/RPN11